MLYGIIITIHVLVCILLIGIVLIQSGRGGGLTETFSSAESIFGTKTNTFLTRATAVLATLFIVGCVALTFLANKRSKSLFDQPFLNLQQKVPAALPVAQQKADVAKPIVKDEAKEAAGSDVDKKLKEEAGSVNVKTEATGKNINEANPVTSGQVVK